MYELLKGLLPDLAVQSQIYRMERLGNELGLDELYIKRDDLTDFYGNKTRHIKYLIAWLRLKKINEVELVGRGDSDCMRMYAQGFKRVGIKFKYNLKSDYGTGNGMVMKQLNQFTNGETFKLPYDSHKEIAALGYVEAVDELAIQMPDVDYIYLYSYDATWMGISVGCWLRALKPRIIAIRGPGAPNGAIGSPRDMSYRNQIYGMIENMTECKVENRRTVCFEVSGKWHHPIVKDILNLEGILLDPVYTGRAMGKLIQDARVGFIPKKAKVLFWHTGGILINC